MQRSVWSSCQSWSAALDGAVVPADRVDVRRAAMVVARHMMVLVRAVVQHQAKGTKVR